MKAIGMFVFMAIVSLLLRTTLLAGLAAHGVVIDVLVLDTVAWSLKQRDALLQMKLGARRGFLLAVCRA